MNSKTTNSVKPKNSVQESAPNPLAGTAKFWGLNEDQEKAFNDEKNCAVVACPGSGKTRLAVAKMAKLILRDGPTSVLAITFTKNAADEMRTRLSSAIGDRLARQAQIGTYHGLSHRKLREVRKYRLLKEYESRDMILRARDRVWPEMKNDHAFEAISRYKAMLSPQHPGGNVDSPLVKEYEVFMAYQETLQSCGAIDMDDLVLQCVQGFVSGEVETYQVKWLLADEFQDTDSIQYQFVMQHAKRGAVVTAVGDDDQSIYGFRSALGHTAITSLQHDINANLHFLSTNYRCGIEIVSSAAIVIAQNNGRIEKKLIAGSSEKGSVEKVEMISTFEEAEAVVGRFMAMVETDKTANKVPEMAVMARTNNLLDAIELVAASQGCLINRIGESGFFSRRHVAQAISAMKFGLNPKDKISLLSAATVAGISMIGVSVLEKSLMSLPNGSNVLDAIYDSSITGEMKKQDATLYREFRNIVMDWYENCTAYAASETTEESAEMKKAIYQLFGYFCARANSSWKKDDLTFLQLILADRMSGPLGKRISLLERWSDTSKKEDDKPRLNLLTLHSSKGLEYDHVWLIGCNEGVIPHKDNQNIEEERRLFYVGMTRAKKTLTLSTVNDGDKQPSRFMVF